MAEEKEVKKSVAKKSDSAAKKPTVKKAVAPKADKPAKEVKADKPVKEVKEEKAVEAAPKVEKAAKPAPKAEKKSSGHKAAKVVNRLQARYASEIKKSLMETYKYSSVMEIPGLDKIVINIGVGDATQDAKRLEEAVAELAMITGQHPIITKAKKSIATFKLREGQEIGCKVTLRGLRMWDFFDKLVSIALPRVRDFRGVSRNAFDGRGNYTLGIKEQLIFPEIDYDKVAKIRGMDIVIVTTAKTDKEAYSLLEALGMPFHR